MTTFVLLNFLDFSASKRRFVLCAMWQRSVRCAERDPSILMRYEFSSTLYSAGIHVQSRMVIYKSVLMGHVGLL